jgi:hypothetical protein
MALLPGERWIVCPGPCGERKLASPDPGRSEFWRHKSREGQIGDGLPRYAYLCKSCAMAERERWGRENRERLNARRRELYAQKKAEGNSSAERRRKQNTEANRRYRERLNADPERMEAERARRRAAWERLKADPERYAEHLANQRIYARMRSERAGTSTRILSYATDGWRGPGRSEGQPVDPLALWVEAFLAREVPDLGRSRGGVGSSRDDRSRTIEDVCVELGVEDRILARIERRTYKTVTLGVADRMLTRYGKPLVIPERAVEARLAEIADFWRSAPGNGERLIGYLTDAERIVHLAGAVVDRVEDLWPALAD